MYLGVSHIMEGDFDAQFVYGPDEQRRYMKIEQGGNVYRERFYLGGGLYEEDLKNGKWRQLAYISTPSGPEALYITEKGTTDHELHFLGRDYLGSIIAIYNGQGSLLEEYSYDAWGNRRDAQTWEPSYTPGPQSNLWNGLLYRGFTGHEHLDCFGLINMNGRLYDPLLGRMLSPDNFVQNVTSTQGLNRYSYVYNNPMIYVDPDGELAWFVPVIIGAAIGAYSGAAVQQNSLNPADWNSDWVSGATVGAIVGAGIGLGFSAAVAGLGGNITGISAVGKAGFAKSAATTTSWNITSNALITSNISIGSGAIQGDDWNDLAFKGVIGLAAGAVGGAYGGKFSRAGQMTPKGRRIQNYTTSLLNGFGDRMYRSIDAGLNFGQTLANSFLGGLEGLTMAHVVSAKSFGVPNKGSIELNLIERIHYNAQTKMNHAFARYMTLATSQIGTSVPGVGFQLGAVFYPVAGAMYSAGGHILGSVLSGSILWGGQTALASSILGWTGAWDNYEQIGAFKPYTIWGR